MFFQRSLGSSPIIPSFSNSFVLIFSIMCWGIFSVCMFNIFYSNAGSSTICTIMLYAFLNIIHLFPFIIIPPCKLYIKFILIIMSVQSLILSIHHVVGNIYFFVENFKNVLSNLRFIVLTSLLANFTS